MKISYVIMLVLVLLVALALPVLAQTYYADIALKETAGNSYTMYPARTAFNTDYMASENFCALSALDTRMLEGTTEIPHMMADNKLLFATDLPASSSKTLRFTTGNSLLSDFDIITGRDGYITTTDHVDLELYSDFSLLWSGWLDATAVGSYLVDKDGAISANITASGNLTAWIEGTAANVTASGTSSRWCDIEITIGSDLCEGGTASAGNFSPLFPASMAFDNIGVNNSWRSTSNSTWLRYDFGASNNQTIVKYTITGDHYNAATTAPQNWTFEASNNAVVWIPVDAQAGQTFANDERKAYSANTTTPYRYYQLDITSTPGGTWIRVLEMEMMDDYLKIFVDGVLEGTSTFGGASVTNNANDWVWLQNNVMPYSDNISISVNGTQELFYEPTSYIVGDTLPDLAGTAQDGTITWGINDTGVSVVVGSLIAYAIATGADPEVGAGEAVGEVRAPSGLFPSEVRMKATLHVLYPAMKSFADVTDFPVQYFWWFGTALMTIAMMVATMKWLPNIWWVGVVGVFSLGMGVGQAFIPGFFIILGVLAVIFAVITERTPSI